MKRVMIIQRRLPEYRLSFFDALRERLAGLGVELHLWHGAPASREVSQGNEGTLPWARRAVCRYVGAAGRNSGQFVWLSVPGEELSTADLVVLPHENKILSNYPVLIGSRQSGRPIVAFWGHGGNFQSASVGGPAERFKAWIARRARWYFAYTALSVDRIVATGFPRERTTCLNNAIDTRQLVRWRESVTAEELEALRKALNAKGERVAVALGSLSKERRLEFLFEAAERLRGEVEGFELLIVGDGAMRGQVAEFARERPWVHWVGAKHGREKVLHAILGQVMLSPGAVGLNILDSLALNLPLVTTNCGIHGPEIAYLRNGENGLMTENTVEAYVAAVAALLREPTPDQGHIFNCQFSGGKGTREAGKGDSGFWILDSGLEATRAETQRAQQSTDHEQRITGGLYARLVEGCKRDAEVYTLEAMVENFAQGIMRALFR